MPTRKASPTVLDLAEQHLAEMEDARARIGDQLITATIRWSAAHGIMIGARRFGGLTLQRYF